MKIDTKVIENSVIYICLILVLIGIFVLGNIGSYRFDNQFFFRQVIWIIITVPFVLLFYRINVKKLRKFALPLLIFGLLLLIGVFIPGVGIRVNNAFRWIDIGPIRFQPSTIARLIFIFYLVHFLVKNKDIIELSNPLQFLKNFIPLIIVPLLYCSLVYIEPDLSSTIILFLIYLSILFITKIKILTIFLILLLVVILFTVSIKTGPQFRKERISAFWKLLNGEKIDREIEKKYFYHSKESLIALSNGGIFGKGSNQGRAKLFYLPSAETDYIFSIMGEEYGFIGSVVLILIYGTLILGCFTLAQRANDLFYSFLIAGLTFNLVYNILINICVVTCIIPSTGVSLPFISYGGSALLIDAVAIAIIINASRRARFQKRVKVYNYV